MLASAHAPVGDTWEAQPGSQQTSGHGTERTSAGIDFTAEREVRWGLSASASDREPVTTHQKLLRRGERRQVRRTGARGQSPSHRVRLPALPLPSDLSPSPADQSLVDNPLGPCEVK